MCGVGCAVRFGANSLHDDHRFTLTPCNVAIAQSGTLVARFLALPLSPSFASPPPSLRSGTSPAGGLICLLAAVRAAAPACLRLCLRIGAHKKRLGPFFVRCRLRRPLCAQRTSICKYKSGDPQPLLLYLHIDNRIALRLADV